MSQVMSFGACVARWGRPEGYTHGAHVTPHAPYWLTCRVSSKKMPQLRINADPPILNSYRQRAWLSWCEYDDLICVNAVEDAVDWCMMRPTVVPPSKWDAKLLDAHIDERADIAIEMYVLHRLASYVNTDDQC